MRSFTKIAWLLLIPTLSWATTPVTKRIDQIGTEGGSLLSVPSSGSNLVSDTGTLTLTNKTLDGNSLITTAVYFEDTSDNTKTLALSLSGNTTGKTLTLSTSQSNSETLAIPNVGSGDTLATLNATQTFGSGSTWNGATLAVGYGGLGITSTPTNGQIPIGNGSHYVAAALTAGNGISISNGSGSITVNAVIDSNVNQNVFYGNSSQTTFTLSATPASSNGVVCYLDGVTQIQGASFDYTVSSATVTQNTAPATGQRLLCVYNKY